MKVHGQGKNWEADETKERSVRESASDYLDTVRISRHDTHLTDFVVHHYAGALAAAFGVLLCAHACHIFLSALPSVQPPTFFLSLFLRCFPSSLHLRPCPFVNSPLLICFRVVGPVQYTAGEIGEDADFVDNSDFVSKNKGLDLQLSC